MTVVLGDLNHEKSPEIVWSSIILSLLFGSFGALPNGMKLIDTPGIKGFGMVNMKIQEIANYFPEFKKLKTECKFHNCLHQNEPKCAVINAFKKGEVAETRYLSYLQMLENDTSYR